MKRAIALLLAAVMLLGIGSALAEGWTCAVCGRAGNDSRFCPDCGSPKPDEQNQVIWGYENRGNDESSYTVVENNIQAGEYVYFGHYEQDDNLANGVEPIRWLVLQADGDRLFLLSEKGLAMHRFNGHSNGETWAGCELRKWLNGTFLREAFQSYEEGAIVTTYVDDSLSQSNSAWNSANRFSGVSQDKVFLLSYQEMSSLVDKTDRFCEPCATLLRQGVYTENHNGHKCCWYWLRTSAYRNNAGVVNAAGEFDTCYLHHEYGVVRPALWVDASAVTK